MSGTNRVPSYTAIEFDSLLASLEQFAVTESGIPLSAVQNPNDLAALFIRLNAAMGETIAFNLNKWVLEAHLIHARRITSVDAIARSLGYERPSQRAATGDLDIRIDLDAVGGSTIIPKESIFSDGTERYTLDADLIAGPGVGIVTVTGSATHAVWVSQTLGTSTGQPRQEYQLTGSSAEERTLVETVVVTVGGTPWTRVSGGAMGLATPTAEVFEIVSANDGTSLIRFGDGINGRIPTALAVLESVYRVGGGTPGNVEAGEIDELAGSLPGFVSVTNPAAFSGGGPEQTLRQAQATIPGFIRTNDRCVVPSDYADVTVTVSGILKAVAEPCASGGGCCGSIILYAVPFGGGSLTAAQIQAIQAALSGKKPPNKLVTVRDAKRAYLDIEVDLALESGANSDDVVAQATNLIADVFDLESVTFGGRLILQSLYDLVDSESVRGLQSMRVRRFRFQPYTDRYVWGSAGDGLVTGISYTGDSRREWRIKVAVGGTLTTAGSFLVYERYVGTISEVSSAAMRDGAAEFASDLAGNGWVLVVDPYGPGRTTSHVLAGNSDTTVSTDGALDLRDFGSARTAYAVERALSTLPGKILNERVLLAVAGGTFNLPLGSQWAIGDKLRITDGTTTYDTSIVGGVSGAWIMADPVPAAGLTTIIADALWSNGELSFVVKQGDLLWATGDEVFIDTFAKASDIVVRDTILPTLALSGLAIRTVEAR